MFQSIYLLFLNLFVFPHLFWDFSSAIYIDFGLTTANLILTTFLQMPLYPSFCRNFVILK